MASVSIWFGIERWKFSKFRDANRTHYGSNPAGQAKSLITRLGVATRFLSKQNEDESLEDEVLSLPLFNGSAGGRSEWRGRLDAKDNINFLDQIRQAYNIDFRRRNKFPDSETPCLSAQGEACIVGGEQSPEGIKAPSFHRSFSEATAVSIATGSSHELGSFCSHLQELEARDMVNADFARTPVRHMQLSPCGDWLVVCWKTTSALYACDVRMRNDRLSTLHIDYGLTQDRGIRFCHTLEEPRTHARKFALLAEWSPDGRHVLVLLRHSVSLWELRAEDAKLIHKRSIGELKMRSLQSLRWLNDDGLYTTTSS